MPLEPFSKFFLEVAQEEIRAFYIPPAPSCGDDDIPPGEYAFFEWYCTELHCDCRRVLLYVVEKNRGVLAAIGYSFDPEPSELLEDFPNPMLDPMHDQSEQAPRFLEFFEQVALDNDYKARLMRHYAMVKDAVDSAASLASKPKRR